jgi:hypothetical protein
VITGHRSRYCRVGEELANLWVPYVKAFLSYAVRQGFARIVLLESIGGPVASDSSQAVTLNFKVLT